MQNDASALGKLILPEIRELIEAADFGTLGDVLNDYLPADLAGIVVALPLDEQPLIIDALHPRHAATTFEYLDLPTQERLLEAFGREKQAQILNEMSPDDRTALLEDLPPETTEQLLGLLSPEQLAIAQSLLAYRAESVGRLMTPDYIAVKDDWTVQQVLDYVREHGKDSETLNVIYVVDHDDHLVDDLRIRELLLVPVSRRMHELMDLKFVALHTRDSKRHAVQVFKKYDRTALPVVDPVGKLVGIVTIDDVLDIAEEEATREMQRLGGLEALDEPYNTTSLLTMVRKRASWLVILFVGELLTATAMGKYEDEIAKAVVLALFVPLIISSGGNSGSQAATLIVRALALGEVKLRDWWFVARRELLSGLMLGGILGTIGFLRIALWSMFSGIYGEHWPLIALTVSLSLVGVVLWGTISGSMLPFLLKWCRLDPATSSAPFVATLVDVTGLLIYFNVALFVLRDTLL